MRGAISIGKSIDILIVYVLAFTTGYQSKAGYLGFNMLNLQLSLARLLSLVSELHYGSSGLSSLLTLLLYWSLEGSIYIFGSFTFIMDVIILQNAAVNN